MPGILPEGSSGAQVIRDGTVCTPQPLVNNAYCPPAGYAANCDITALPMSCDAVITPAQINAIVSELMALAVCFDPNGPWDCNSVTNLCAHFNAWVAAQNAQGDGVTITANAPYALIPFGAVNAICASAPARAALMQCILSNDADNSIVLGADGGLFFSDPDAPVYAGDGITIDADGLAPNTFSIIPAGTVNAICGDVAARAALIQCVLSNDAGNEIVLGLDGGLYVGEALIPPGIIECDDTVVVAKATGASERRAPILPEPLEHSVFRNSGAGNADLRMKDQAAPGMANALFSPIFTDTFTNPDPCRPMQVSVASRAEATYVAREGGAFTIQGQLLVDPGTGVLAANTGSGLTAAMSGHASPAGGQQITDTRTTYRLEPYAVLVPPGGMITFRFQISQWVNSIDEFNNMQANPDPNVFAINSAHMYVFGRSL